MTSQNVRCCEVLTALQAEKEALDDLAMELELAGEEEPVLCVLIESLFILLTSSLISEFCDIGIRSGRYSCTCGYPRR